MLKYPASSQHVARRLEKLLSGSKVLGVELLRSIVNILPLCVNEEMIVHDSGLFVDLTDGGHGNNFPIQRQCKRSPDPRLGEVNVGRIEIEMFESQAGGHLTGYVVKISYRSDQVSLRLRGDHIDFTGFQEPDEHICIAAQATMYQAFEKRALAVPPGVRRQPQRL